MPDNFTHGSARFATEDDLREAGYFEGKGLTWGAVSLEDDWFGAIRHEGDGHAVTVARTRSGKGVTTIIPHLLDHDGALLCIDPKGENAIITAEARESIHGQKVAILDPWGIACGVLERDADQFNPLDMLSADDDNLADDAMLLADALIVPDGGESHWSNEARSLVMGFIVHLVTSPDEEGRRHLGRLREILSLPPAEFQSLVMDMSRNGVTLARSAAHRTMQKSERELSSVISTAQQNTHFLEGPRLQRSLEKSTFDFAGLKDDEARLSVYIVLPAERLNTHGRWLRLVVSCALTTMTRGGRKPKRPALFMLDEFAALGKLAIVEQAFGLMAGFGMKIHAILQDLSQLQDLYDRRWQTFIANAEVLQVFGTRDLMTAEYVSKMAGRMTVERISVATQEKRDKRQGWLSDGDPNYTAMADQTSGRALIMPEELIRMGKWGQLLILPDCQPIRALKVPYYRNARYFNDAGQPLFRVHPDHEEPPAPRAFDLEMHVKLGGKRRPDPLADAPKGSNMYAIGRALGNIGKRG